MDVNTAEHGSGHEQVPEHRVERMMFFSDAVIAIAITLLVIEIHVPHLPHTATASDFAHALVELLPNFVGFFISFFVIGAFWGGHHRAFAVARMWDERLAFANLSFLCAVAAMPFVTALLSANGGALFPVLLYCSWLLLTALLSTRLQRILTSAPVVDPAASPERIGNIRRRGYAVALGAATAILVAIIAPVPVFGQVALLSIPLWRLFLERRARQPAPVAA